MAESIIGRARKEGAARRFAAINIRDYAVDKHNRVDDTLYGGGNGDADARRSRLPLL